MSTSHAIAVADALVHDARAHLNDNPAASGDLIAQAWHALEQAGRGVSQSPALAKAWRELAAFIVCEHAPVALNLAPHIRDDDERANWYLDTAALLRSVFVGWQQLHAAGHIARSIDAIMPEANSLLDAIEEMATAPQA